MQPLLCSLFPLQGLLLFHTATLHTIYNQSPSISTTHSSNCCVGRVVRSIFLRAIYDCNSTIQWLLIWRGCRPIAGRLLYVQRLSRPRNSVAHRRNIDRGTIQVKLSRYAIRQRYITKCLMRCTICDTLCTLFRNTSQDVACDMASSKETSK